jgi:hypothetical protein
MVPPTLVGHNPILAFKFDATPPGTLSARMDPLASPGIVADDENEDPNREKWVNKPAKCRRHDVEQDADSRPQHLRYKDRRGQMRFHKLAMAVQMRKGGQPRRLHKPGYQGVENRGGLLIRKVAIAECTCRHSS